MKMSKNDRNELIEVMVRSFAAKEDLRNFATKEDRAVLRGEFKADKGELEVKIAEVKSDVIRRMFAFFVNMLLAILGLYLKK
jgi:TusA-related sulfurtransferase